MESRWNRTMAAVLALVVVTAGGSLAWAGDYDDTQRYAVTITNVTRGQVLSPPLVVSHFRAVKLFEPGQPASPELAQLAEDAVSGPLIALLGTYRGVFDVQLGSGVIPPGESLTVEVEVKSHFRTISVAGMLVSTNDAFYAARGSVQPRGKGKALTAIAYDAGSEANTESCDHIPGPPCGNPLVRVTDGAEGFVHVHAGVQGTGDLMSAMKDWRNPVAYVTFERIRN